MLKKLRQSHVIKWALKIFLGLFVFFGIFFLSIYLGFWGKIPTSTDLSVLKQSEATEVFSSEEKLIGKYYVFDRQLVLYEELPQHLIDALVATEDVRFYEHSGIDKRSILRVLFKTILLQDESSGGGSTITLQLAKNLFGRNDYGYFGIAVNKIREAVIAKRLENIYSKKEILALYFNTVPFSDNTYGIESAARKFFSKSTAELSLAESATLVGTLKASHYYNPRIYPERSTLRRNIVLYQMKKYGFLDSNVLAETKQKPIKLNYQMFNYNAGIAPYFREQVRKDVAAILDTMENKNGEKYNIYRDGLKVYTTLDYEMQQLAEEAVKEHMTVLQEEFEESYGTSAPWKNEEFIKSAISETPYYQSLKKSGWNEQAILDSLGKKSNMKLFSWQEEKMLESSIVDSLLHYKKFLNTGMLAMDPSSGAVKAWIGGINFENFKYDHVSQSKRQIGSTFKPIVYATALEQGIDPCTYYSIREVTYLGGWTPSNATETEDPDVNYSMEAALSNSINTIAVKVLHDAGLENVIDQAQEIGISSEIPEVPSIALGTAELNIKELATAYSAFANRGFPSTPYYITRIEDKYGNLIAEFQPKTAEKQALSSTTAKIILEMMKSTVNSGTAERLRWKYNLPNDIAGKTGTTQNNKDGWFVGITPNLLSVTWVGADDHRIGFPSTALGQGANAALPIFGKLLQKMNADSDFNKITRAEFDPPSETIQMLLNCEPTKRNNFIERLFTNSRKPKQQQEEKKGFFSKVKDLFTKDDDR